LGSDVCLGTPFDEEGAEDLVAALERLGRLKEKSTARVVVHDRSSGSRVTLSRIYLAEATATSEQCPEPSTAKGREKPERQDPRRIDQQMLEDG
jgi:hypothetical protein